MRNYIKKQLEKCSWADFSRLDPKTGVCAIPRFARKSYSKGKCYLVRLSTGIVNNPNSVLAANYNSGSFPTYFYYKAFVSRVAGKMIYADCRAYDYENRCDINAYWSGWLELAEMEQIACLN